MSFPDMSIDEIKELILEIKKRNPYPVDVFPEPTKGEYSEFHKTLRQHGFTAACFSGAMGRIAWNTCCEDILKRIEYEKQYREAEEAVKRDDESLKHED